MAKIQAKQALTDAGWVADIEIDIGADGKILNIGPAQLGDAHQVDVLLPAPANLHSHSFQRAMAGLTEARGPDVTDSFWSWRRLMYHFLDQLSPDQVEAIAAQVFMEMAEAGYSSVAEFHYLHHGPNGQPYDNIAELAERIASAASRVGLGLTLLPVQYEFGGCDHRPLTGGQKRFGTTKDQFAALFGESRKIIAKGPTDWGIGVAPHSLRAVDSVGLRQAIELAQGLPLHMHLAEQMAEVAEVEAALGARPVEWVLDNLPVDDSFYFIHCTQMTANETHRLARSGAVAGLCPITESSLGDGIFNGTQYLSASGSIGVGSDSNVHISLWDELKTLEYSQRLRDKKRAILATPDHSTGRRLFDSAVKGGALAAGRASGRITVGAWADLLGVNMDNEVLANRTGDTVLDSLMVLGSGNQCLTDVWSAGRHIVKEGWHIDRSQIVSEYTSVLGQLE